MSDKAKFISNITKNGMSVLSKVTQGNGKKLKFTKMAVGDGQIVDADGKVLPSFDPIQMTELHHKMMDMPIIRYQDKGNGTTSVTGRIDNKDLKKGSLFGNMGYMQKTLILCKKCFIVIVMLYLQTFFQLLR